MKQLTISVLFIQSFVVFGQQRDFSSTFWSNTYSQSFALDVDGNLNITGDLYNNGEKVSLGSKWDTLNNVVFVLQKNVGIGTTNPQSQLQIERPNGHQNGATLNLKHGESLSHFSQNASGGVLHLYQNGNISQTILRSYGDSYINATIGNTGIGTYTPRAKLEVSDGDVYISGINKGLIMKDADSNCWKVTVNTDGSLSSNSIICP